MPEKYAKRWLALLLMALLVSLPGARLKASPPQAAGNLPGKDFGPSLMRSLTPQQAAGPFVKAEGNALAVPFNDQRDRQSLSADESRNLIEQQRGNDQFVIMDVRTAQEFMQGHIDGAVSIDYYAPGFEEVLRGLDKDKTYLVYCRSGNRSAQTLIIGEKLGFHRMHHMSAGIVEWQAKGYPLVGGR